MKEFIFYTTEGYTAAPNENYEVENCQVMGVALGNSKYDALDNLIAENPWIEEAGFDPIYFICRQLVPIEEYHDVPHPSETPMMYGHPETENEKD